MAHPLGIKTAFPQRSQVSGRWVFVHPVIWLSLWTNSSWLWPPPCLTSVYLLSKTKLRQESWMKTFWILFPSPTRWWHLSCLSLRHFMSPLNPQPEGLLCCSHPSGLKSSKARIFSCLSVYIHNRCSREWSIERIVCMFVESQFCWHHLCDHLWASLNLS